MLYKPKWLTKAKSVAPKQLKLEEAPIPEEEIPCDLVEDMVTAERALQQQLTIPAKSRFVGKRAVHLQFDGGS